MPPVALGIDELHAGTGKPCTVITEIGRENQHVFEVLPRPTDEPTDEEEERDRKKELEDYLKDLRVDAEAALFSDCVGLTV